MGRNKRQKRKQQSRKRSSETLDSSRAENNISETPKENFEEQCKKTLQEMLKDGKTSKKLQMFFRRHDLNIPAFMLAIALGQKDMVEQFLSTGLNINLQMNPDGYTALMFAVLETKVDIVELILMKDGDPFICDKDGNTALMLSIRTRNRTIFNMLWSYMRGKKEFLLNKRNKKDETLLTLAVKENWISCVEYLAPIPQVDKDVQDMNGETPLMYSAKIDNVHCVQILLKFGADLLVENKNGCTALCLTESNNTEGNEHGIPMKISTSAITILDAMQRNPNVLRKFIQRRVEMLVQPPETCTIYPEILKTKVLHSILLMKLKIPEAPVLFRQFELMDIIVNGIERYMRCEEMLKVMLMTLLVLLVRHDHYERSNVDKERPSDIVSSFVSDFVEMKGPDICLKAIMRYAGDKNYISLRCWALLPLFASHFTSPGKCWLQEHYTELGPFINEFKNSVRDEIEEEKKVLKCSYNDYINLFLNTLDGYESIRKEKYVNEYHQKGKDIMQCPLRDLYPSHKTLSEVLNKDRETVGKTIKNKSYSSDVSISKTFKFLDMSSSRSHCCSGDSSKDVKSEQEKKVENIATSNTAAKPVISTLKYSDVVSRVCNSGEVKSKPGDKETNSHVKNSKVRRFPSLEDKAQRSYIPGLNFKTDKRRADVVPGDCSSGKLNPKEIKSSTPVLWRTIRPQAVDKTIRKEILSGSDQDNSPVRKALSPITSSLMDKCHGASASDTFISLSDRSESLMNKEALEGSALKSKSIDFSRVESSASERDEVVIPGQIGRTNSCGRSCFMNKFYDIVKELKERSSIGNSDTDKWRDPPIFPKISSLPSMQYKDDEFELKRESIEDLSFPPLTIHLSSKVNLDVSEPKEGTKFCRNIGSCQVHGCMIGAGDDVNKQGHLKAKSIGSELNKMALIADVKASRIRSSNDSSSVVSKERVRNDGNQNILEASGIDLERAKLDMEMLRGSLKENPFKITISVSSPIDEEDTDTSLNTLSKYPVIKSKERKTRDHSPECNCDRGKGSLLHQTEDEKWKFYDPFDSGSVPNNPNLEKEFPSLKFPSNQSSREAIKRLVAMNLKSPPSRYQGPISSQASPHSPSFSIKAEKRNTANPKILKFDPKCFYTFGARSLSALIDSSHPSDPDVDSDPKDSTEKPTESDDMLVCLKNEEIHDLQERLKASKEDKCFYLGDLKFFVESDDKHAIGKGMFSDVVVGLSQENRGYAAKRIPKANLSSYTTFKKIVNTCLIQLEHENILEIQTLYEESGIEYLIVPLCEINLHTYVEKLASMPDDVKKMNTSYSIKGIAEGLKYLHTRGHPVIHGNMKPTNILYNSRGQVKLADFGVHQFYAFNSKPDRICTRWWARETVETYRKSWRLHIELKSDIQVAGMIVYYVITLGDYVFGCEDSEANLLSGKYTLDLSDEVVRDLIDWMLESKIIDRPSVLELLKHMYFWKPREKFRFLLIASGAKDRGVEIGYKQKVLDYIDHTAVEMGISSNWIENIKYEHYLKWIKSEGLGDQLSHLLKFICYFAMKPPHPNDNTDTGDYSEEFQSYVLTTFPTLTFDIYKILRDSPWEYHPHFAELMKPGTFT